jgi:hypothetical protein
MDQIQFLEVLLQLVVVEAAQPIAMVLMVDLAVEQVKQVGVRVQVAQQALQVKVMLVVIQYQAAHFGAVAVADLVLLDQQMEMVELPQHLLIQVHHNLMQVGDRAEQAEQDQLQLQEQMLVRVEFQLQAQQAQLLTMVAAVAAVVQIRVF